MSVSLYDVTIPVFIRSLEAMAEFLDKGRAFVKETGLPEADLLEARLFEDMAPLPAQVQRASDAAKFTAARMAQVEAPAMPDTETSFDELQARIAATIDFLKTVPANSMDGREDAEITLQTPGQSFAFAGTDYVRQFALPNFFFHVTTAYALLRMKGVPVGKLDFLGGI